jgi:hypothetical protein
MNVGDLSRPSAKEYLLPSLNSKKVGISKEESDGS